ncbi:hypothetical protein GCM10008024_24000 [Allgaiera indica]|uniref:Uncharacterized protein n=1 Tax=Allgaiera indica TaxID=765699 RepID=A0AAN5A0R6_9RHOB|nr:hypothetical protein GCM10008024_24000 [Allgaiera indica]
MCNTALGTYEMIQVHKRRATAPTLLTQVMRLGAHPVRDSAQPPRGGPPADPLQTLALPWRAALAGVRDPMTNKPFLSVQPNVSVMSRVTSTHAAPRVQPASTSVGQ